MEAHLETSIKFGEPIYKIIIKKKNKRNYLVESISSRLFCLSSSLIPSKYRDKLKEPKSSIIIQRDITTRISNFMRIDLPYCTSV